MWCDPYNHVLFVHQRLAIIDLSKSGHQPMQSASGRYVLCFNGEIYNHQELRLELDASGNAPSWCGHSDTETILAFIEAFGLEKALKKCVGMFAFALWDRHSKDVYLARDRLGEKPLYYGQNGQILFFASELKALRAHPEFSPTVDRDALCLFLRHNYIPQPFSIYQGIKKLPPGHFIKLEPNAMPTAYWSVDSIIHAVKDNPFEGSDEQALDVLDQALMRAIKGQMQADVPLGAFLSGGVDSSLIVAMMQEQTSRPVKSFSIGFEDKQFDEAPFAKEVARHLGTDHHELYVSADQARNVIPELPKLYDEPFSDSSQIPTFLVSQMARQQVTVSLSGDAGDELFGGYNRYIWGQNIWSKLNAVPRPVRNFGAAAMTGISPINWNKFLRPLLAVAPQKFRHNNVGDKIHKLAGVVGASSPEAVYRTLISHWDCPDDIVIAGLEPATILTTANGVAAGLPFVERMMYYDLLTYLPDDILVKVDRAAMGVSLETRVPFLDRRVVELAWQLPLHLKIRDGVGKWCLRELLFRRVPKHLIERPKTGFAVPVGDWLRGPLRDWAETLLDTRRLKSSGYFNAGMIETKWREHLSGDRNWHYYLWDILM
ncbi:MAG: asparagine synthase (glutamine-hydrolyzing), partial [Alphaproteobacteria bacterium]